MSSGPNSPHPKSFSRREGTGNLLGETPRQNQLHTAFEIEKKRRDNKVNEANTKCKIVDDNGGSKHTLNFNLGGEACPVTKKTDNQFITDTVTLESDYNGKLNWNVETEESDKYEIIVKPSNGKLRKKGNQKFQINMRVFCSTRIRTWITIWLDGKSSSLPKTPLYLFVILDTGFSKSLDYDEIEKLEQIGRGGNGIVFRARWRGSEYALKEFQQENYLVEAERELIQREIGLMETLPPNKYVVSFAGSTKLDSQKLCILMEYVPKGSLLNLLKKSNLRNPFRCKIAHDIARGMTFLHHNRIYHRDLKPGNLLVVSEEYKPDSDEANIKITDFGTSRVWLNDPDNPYGSITSLLASKLSNQTKKTSSANTEEPESLHTRGLGTLEYTAPEMLLGNTNYQLDKLDVFSYGVLLWEIFQPTHVIPYSKPEDAPYTKSRFALVEYVKSGKRLEISNDIPPAIRSLISRCWDQDSNKRPSFDEIVKIFNEMNYKNLEYPDIDESDKVFIAFHGAIDRETATKRLLSRKPHEPGLFLTRWKIEGSGGSFVISYVKEDMTVGHIAGIRKVENGIEVNGNHFDNLKQCYSAFYNQVPPKIRIPLDLQENEEQDYEQPNIV